MNGNGRRDLADRLGRLGAAVALAFVLFQGWLLWTEARQSRDPYREPRGRAVKVNAPGEGEFSWAEVWHRMQEFYITGE
ncbi:MAG: DUF4227 family protein [Alicyclobacillaceae bacterium]|nr:DUF4227 family protein [Alicyclobacillaceae bacterium]